MAPRSDTRAEAEAACRELRARFGLGGAPADIGPLAKRVGIERVILADIPLDGMVAPTETKGYAVVLRKTNPPTRQRFTLAHEIAHLALRLPSSSCFASAGRRVDAERAANWFAAEVLLPKAQLIAIVREPSVQSLLHLAREFKVSPETAGLRMVELGLWSAVVVRWSEQSRPGSTRKLRVDWSATPAAARLYIPRWVPAPQTLSDWWRTSSERSKRHDPVRLRLGSIRGDHAVDSLRLADGLLSLIQVPTTVTRRAAF